MISLLVFGAIALFICWISYAFVMALWDSPGISPTRPPTMQRWCQEHMTERQCRDWYGNKAVNDYLNERNSR